MGTTKQTFQHIISNLSSAQTTFLSNTNIIICLAKSINSSSNLEKTGGRSTIPSFTLQGSDILTVDGI